MSSQSKRHPGRLLAMLPAMFVVLCMFATLAAAQDPPAPKWELYGGYSFLYPGADVHGQLPGGLLPLTSRMESNPRGIGVSATYNFNRWFGLTLDASTHWGSGESTLVRRIDDAAFSNISLGPKITFRGHRFSPFLEALVGDHRLTPDAFHDIDKIGIMAGGGLDVNVHRHVALRLIRADWVWSSYRFGPAATTPSTDLSGIRLQAGIVFLFGGERAETPPSASCSVQPNEVFAGETVTATATGSNFNPKRTVTYNWNGTGVKVAGTSSSTQIDTTGLQPGSYGVTARLSDGSKHGSASCSGKFRVKTPRPPEISCSPDPASVRIGGTSTIRSNASSPDGRRLSYSYTTSGGRITGEGATVTWNSGDTRPGVITVTCTVEDDRNPPLTASSTTTVNVEAPPPPAPEIKELEARLALHSIYFQTSRPTIGNPGGGLVDSQGNILKTLAEDFIKYLKYSPDAHLIIGGHADPRGSVPYNKGLTERRVGRTKSYLVERGVPADHIETRSFGKEDQLTAEQVKAQIADNPDISQDDRQQMLNNLPVMVLANNRRVDVTLSTTGEQSTRRYPFNAQDYLALISTKGGEKESKPTVKPKGGARKTRPPVKKKPAK
ncbi:MAG TPA: OmpA family protein [Candidatus Acidoferrales bacterium]|nr:OmpA family protein [Candidatus Acidoferrales bacterium]